MSNINASVSNESREKYIPKAEELDSEMKSQETKVLQGQSYTSTANKDSDINTSKIKAKSIGNYILGKTLGEGTFGKVKLATHILTGEKVAIKILEKDRIIDVSDVERVAREIYILKFIRHPNIIQLYEIIETPKQLFLVTEYISGGELFDYIVANSRVEEKEASKFFHQIIAGVEYIHRLKIVHRDLKPENLLLDYNKNIKIVDFGLSNTYNENELLKTACGSPCYAAPEMIGGKKYNGLQVDIWSCGVILFAIVCGYLPFEDPNTAALYKKILSGDYTIPSFVSEDGRDLIKNILTTDPAKRYTIEDIRKHPWMNQMEMPKKSEGIIVGYHQMPIDLSILNQLEQYGFQYDNAQKCLDGNQHNPVTTTYYLLLRKFHQNGGQSPADINANNFDKNLLMPKTHQPRINNYYSVGQDYESEKENDKKGDRERSRKKSTDQSQSFINAESSFRQRQSKEIAKIYGSILDSCSRDRVSSSNYSSKGSRILKENTLFDNNEIKRKSLTGKRASSPARNDTKEEKTSKISETKEIITPSNYKSNNPKSNHFFNKSFNNSTLKERLREIYRIGGDRAASKTKHPRGESFDESNNELHQSMNHELLNDSFKVEAKDTNASMIYPMQPKLHDYTAKGNSKKQAFISIQSTPKKEKRVVHLDEKINQNPVLSYETKFSSNPKVSTAHHNYYEKSRTSSQSPSKFTQILPKEPSYIKPRDSSVNPYRAKIHSRKTSSTRPAVQLNNGKAWRPSTNQNPTRERGRSIGAGDESTQSQNVHDMSVNLGSASYMLNSSFQKHPDMSFDYSNYQAKAYMSNIVSKRVSYGGEAHNKRGRASNFSPVDGHRKNLQSLLNKTGVVKC